MQLAKLLGFKLSMTVTIHTEQFMISRIVMLKESKDFRKMKLSLMKK
jgi:hypothetical protein